jgi:hypothetical protein
MISGYLGLFDPEVPTIPRKGGETE